MITVKSKVKEIVENPEALAVVKGVYPAFDETNPGMNQAYGMSLKALPAFPATKSPKDKQKEISEAREDAGIE